MKWLVVTVVLLGASAGLVSGLYLRDRDASSWLPPGRTVAHHDAMAVAAAIGATCPRECDVKLLGHPRTDHWTEWIRVPAATVCVDIDVRTFATDQASGLSGVTKVPCRAAAAAQLG
jgi:hypothetical protein